MGQGQSVPGLTIGKAFVPEHHIDQCGNEKGDSTDRESSREADFPCSRTSPRAGTKRRADEKVVSVGEESAVDKNEDEVVDVVVYKEEFVEDRDDNHSSTVTHVEKSIETLTVDDATFSDVRGATNEGDN